MKHSFGLVLPSSLYRGHLGLVLGSSSGGSLRGSSLSMAACGLASGFGCVQRPSGTSTSVGATSNTKTAATSISRGTVLDVLGPPSAKRKLAAVGVFGSGTSIWMSTVSAASLEGSGTMLVIMAPVAVAVGVGFTDSGTSFVVKSTVTGAGLDGSGAMLVTMSSVAGAK